MDKNQQNSRRAAARQFVNSLDALETVFQSEEESSLHTQEVASDTSDYGAERQNAEARNTRDDVVQDIEQFTSSSEKDLT
jgi:hypothetical protein